MIAIVVTNVPVSIAAVMTVVVTSNALTLTVKHLLYTDKVKILLTMGRKMSLSVATLAGFPAINTASQRSAGTPTDAATYSFTNGVYTAGTVYVAGILDQQGVNPSRIFFSDNATGGGTTGTVNLPKLVSITQVSAHGQSLQELASNYSGSVSYNEYADAVGYSGYQLILNATPASADDGVYPLGFDNATTLNPNAPGWTSQGGAYTGATTTGYPNPQMRFFVTLNALLIIASTATG